MGFVYPKFQNCFVVKISDFFFAKVFFDKLAVTVPTYKRLLIQTAIMFEDICQLQGTVRSRISTASLLIGGQGTFCVC